MNKYFFLAFLFFSNTLFAQINPGVWHGELILHDTIALPFNFEVVGNKATIRNADERITADITHKADSDIIRLPDFDAEIHVKNDQEILTGEFFNLSRKTENVIPFRALINSPFRFFDRPEKTNVDISGNWKATFDGEDDENKKSLAIFKQEGNHISGTFLTNTGDYRYLEGEMGGNQIYLSAFDGAHAFLFTAEVKDNKIINGHFFSGLHWHDTWSAVRDDKFQLPDERSFTHLKDGFSKVEFTFPDINGNIVSLADARFKNKVVIIQIMGSWCPNCLDETRYLSQWINERKNKNIQIIGLDYEKITDTTVAFKNIKRMIDRYSIQYPILFAGSNNRELSSKTLPMLNRVFSYPTTIFVNKDGTVREIHTGFNGPATGQYFEAFKIKFNKLIDEMLLK